MAKLKVFIILIFLAPLIYGQLRYLPPTPDNIARTKDQFTQERLKHPEYYLVLVRNKEVIVRSNNWFYQHEGLFYRNFCLAGDSINFDKRIIGNWGNEDESILFMITKPVDSKYLILNSYKYFDYTKQYVPEQQNVQLGLLTINGKFYIEFNSAGNRQFIQKTNKYFLINYVFSNEDKVEFRQVSKRYHYKNPDIEITDESPVVSFIDAYSFRSYIEKSQHQDDFYLNPFAMHRVKRKIVIAATE